MGALSCGSTRFLTFEEDKYEVASSLVPQSHHRPFRHSEGILRSARNRKEASCFFEASLGVAQSWHRVFHLDQTPS
jgi:hypothetical protein